MTDGAGPPLGGEHMDPVTITTVVALSTLTSSALVAALAWLCRSMIEHWFSRSLEDRKGQLARQLEDRKAVLQGQLTEERVQIEGEVKKAIETQLGDRAAQRQYEFEARKRLYLAIGPLRFQLLLACRDLAGRVQSYASTEHYAMDVTGYYGRSTLYRLLRPLAISELIERQIAYSDFAVDDGAMDCLRFKRSAAHIWSGDEIVLDHPDVDWSQQAQHAYSDSIIIAANAMIQPSVSQPGVDRVLRFDEFTRMVAAQGFAGFEPFPSLLTGFTVKTKSILWLRLLAYANTCNGFVIRGGKPLGFEAEPFDLDALLAKSDDTHIRAKAPAYRDAIDQLALMSL